MRKILIVDDSKTSRDLMGAILTESNSDYEIFEADSGKGALQVLEKSLPDLILMDVMMPGMSGFEACEALKRDSQFKSIPVIFVTIAEDRASKIKGLEVGGADYITKPINAEELVERVQTHLRTKRILIIDDEPEILETLSMILEKKGFEVITADNGSRGLSLFKDSNIPIVLVDVKMPGMSGIEVLKNIKDLSSDCVVIIMTGHAAIEDSIQAVKLGAYDYLLKSFDSPEEVVLVCQRGMEQYYYVQQRKNMIKTLERANRELLNKSEELEMAQAQLVQSAKLAAMGELGAGIAHELNQPLMGISMYIESAKKRDSVKNDEDLKETLKKIKNQIQRMRGVVDNLRTFARDTKPCYEEVDINDPLNNAFSLVRQQMIDNGIDPQIKLGKDIPKIIGDSNRLQQVFINLIANAKDALDEVENKKNKCVLIESKMDDAKEMVEVKIKDNGAGMDKVTQERMFDPFFTTKPEGKGTGLGLSISYGIIKDHHGKIFMKSEVGVGTIFSILLPYAD